MIRDFFPEQDDGNDPHEPCPRCGWEQADCICVDVEWDEDEFDDDAFDDYGEENEE